MKMGEDLDFVDVISGSYGNSSEDCLSVECLGELDTSEFPFPNILWHVKPATEITIKTSAMLIIGVPGIYLNAVILLIIVKNKWLWSVSNYLIGNLAFIDLLTLIMCPWFMLVRDFYQKVILKHYSCQIDTFFQGSLLLANVGAVILVSYDRMAAAALTSEARITRSAVPKLIIGSWILAMLLSLPWLIKTSYMERQWMDYLETFCVEDPQFLGVYWHFALSLLVWVPMGILVVTYGTIMWRLERSTRELSKRNGGQMVSRAKTRAMRVIACVLLADVLCRVPYSALVYTRNRNSMTINSIDGPFLGLWFAANYLMYFNCAINPLIYGFTNPRYRKAMDRTPGVACCKFGSWCCVCCTMKKKKIEMEDKHTEKIFVIESSPRPNKKLSKIIKNIFHINKDTVELSVPKIDEVTTKPTKVTPLNPELA